MKMRSIALRAVFAVSLMCAAIDTTACSQNPTQVTTPGAINKFDETAYKTLLDSKAALDQAKTDPARAQQFKEVINQAGAAYNTANDAYQAYHAALASGQKPDTAQVAALLSVLSADIAQLRAALGGK